MAEEDQEKQESPLELQGRRKGAWIKWLIIGGVGLAVIGCGLAGGIYYFKFYSNGNGSHKSEKASAGILWPMEPFIVNLADNTGDRYLKAVIQLEIIDQENTVLEQLKPKFRDCVLDTLSSKSFKELMDLNGKQRLREDIAFKLNSLLSKGRIVRVYFTEFVIQ